MELRTGLAGLARCTRCGVLYEQSDEHVRCVYHPGEFMVSNSTLGSFQPQFHRTWSCCKREGEAAAGCVIDNVHMRCERTAEALSKFPQDPKAVSGLRRRTPSSAEPGGTEEVVDPPKRDRNAPPENATKYTCVVGDTVAAVALKHGMRADQVKRWNKLLNPTLFAGQQLWVCEPPPKSDAEKRAEALRTIMRRATGGGCSLPEATYYLDEAGKGHDVRAALSALEADIAASAQTEA